MSERIEFEEQEANGNVVAVSVRKVYLASWGAVSYATDFGQNSINNISEISGKLVGKGEEIEKSTRETVSKEMTTRQKDLQKRTKKLEKEANKRFEGLLHSVNIPTRSDINKLNNKVARLSKQLDELAKAQEA